MKSAARVLIFTGDGKGKTTAALGMALRAAGHGMRVKIIQFVKADSSTGEIAALANVPGAELVQTGRGFVPKAGSPQFVEHVEAARGGLKVARAAIESRDYGLVVLDEICFAVSRHMLDENDVLELVRVAGEGTTLVLTGRGATPALIDSADTVTEMRVVKHGMSAGWPAQEGVEY